MNQIGLFMKKLRVWMIAVVLTVCGTVANAQLSKGHFFKTSRAVPSCLLLLASISRTVARWPLSNTYLRTTVPTYHRTNNN